MMAEEKKKRFHFNRYYNNKHHKDEEVKEQPQQPQKPIKEEKVEEVKTQTQTENTEQPQQESCSPKQKEECCNIKEEFVKLKYQFSEFVNKYRDHEKEFENYKRRTKEEIKEAKEDGVAKAVKALIPALTTFKNAKKLITDEKSLNGIELIEKSILSEFEKLGVKKIECIDTPFDPSLHNAVMLVENPEKSGLVVDEVEAGYIMGDKVIKFSQVVVAR